MRKFLYIVGSMTLVFGSVAAIATCMLVLTGRGLDAESKAYVDTAVPAITAHWSKDALLDRATPELRAAVNPQQIATLFDNLSQLGPLVEYEGATGDSNATYFIGKGSQVGAFYRAKAKYENGEATVQLGLLKRDGEWRIQNFRVDGQPAAPASKSM